MKLIDLLTSEERQQLRVRHDDASFPDYVNELLNKEVDAVKRGRWKNKITGWTEAPPEFVCSVCGWRTNCPTAHCPTCGAYMVAVEE